MHGAHTGAVTLAWWLGVPPHSKRLLSCC